MIINCPYCSAPVVKGFDELVERSIPFSFECKCAKCGKLIKAVIEFQRVVVINSEKIVTKLNEGNIRILGEQ